MTGNGYLQKMKSHFESNKRSKEYTAHQSKVSEPFPTPWTDDVKPMSHDIA